MVRMGKWRDSHEDPTTDFLLRVVRRDMTTLLIVLLVVFLLGGGGWGYSRWRRERVLSIELLERTVWRTS
jgi:uncharacterized membrane protein